MYSVRCSILYMVCRVCTVQYAVYVMYSNICCALCDNIFDAEFHKVDSATYIEIESVLESVWYLVRST